MMTTLMEAKLKGILLGKGLKVEDLFPVLGVKSRQAMFYKFKHEAFKLTELRKLATFLAVPLADLIDG